MPQSVLPPASNFALSRQHDAGGDSPAVDLDLDLDLAATNAPPAKPLEITQPIEPAAAPPSGGVRPPQGTRLRGWPT